MTVDTNPANWNKENLWHQALPPASTPVSLMGVSRAQEMDGQMIEAEQGLKWIRIQKIVRKCETDDENNLMDELLGLCSWWNEREDAYFGPQREYDEKHHSSSSSLKHCSSPNFLSSPFSSSKDLSDMDFFPSTKGTENTGRPRVVLGELSNFTAESSVHRQMTCKNLFTDVMTDQSEAKKKNATMVDYEDSEEFWGNLDDIPV